MSLSGNRVDLTVRRSLPVYPDKQTFLVSVGMSQKCQLLPFQTCIPARLQPPRRTPKSCSSRTGPSPAFNFVGKAADRRPFQAWSHGKVHRLKRRAAEAVDRDLLSCSLVLQQGTPLVSIELCHAAWPPECHTVGDGETLMNGNRQPGRQCPVRVICVDFGMSASCPVRG